MAVLRGRYLNIRDTVDIACVAAIIGSIYGGLATLSFSRVGDIPAMAFGVLTFVSLALLLVYCATAGWWLMRFVGSRVRVNRLPVFAMAGMAGGILVDAVGVGIAISNYGVGSMVPSTREGVGILVWCLSIAPCYLTVAAVLGGVRWRQLEKREIV